MASVQNASVITDFYSLRGVGADKQGEVEDYLAAIEDAAAEAIESVVSGGVSLRSVKIREPIAAWAAMQHLRVPVARERIAVMHSVMRNIIAGGISGTAARAVEPAAPGIHDADSVHDQHLKAMFAGYLPTVENFYNRGWSILRFSRKALLTSDAPVTLLPVEDADERTPLGVTSNGGVLVPLDRRVALVMGELGERDRQLRGTTQVARAVNQYSVSNARRWVFHHPEDAPLEGLILPEPEEPQIRYERWPDGQGS